MLRAAWADADGAVRRAPRDAGPWLTRSQIGFRGAGLGIFEAGAEARRQLSPMRTRRYLFSDMNPFMMPIRAMAGLARDHRAPAAADNPFLALEKAWADGVERSIDAWRDARDAWIESAFHAIYGGLAAVGVTGDDSAAEAEAWAGLYSD